MYARLIQPPDASFFLFGTRPEEKLFESYIFQIIRHEIENERRYQDVFYWAPSRTRVCFSNLTQWVNGFGYFVIGWGDACSSSEGA